MRPREVLHALRNDSILRPTYRRPPLRDELQVTWLRGLRHLQGQRKLLISYNASFRRGKNYVVSTDGARRGPMTDWKFGRAQLNCASSTETTRLCRRQCVSTLCSRRMTGSDMRFGSLF